MKESNDLDALENRLKKLELKIFGRSSKDEVHPKVLPKLFEVATTVNNAVTPRPKLISAMDKLSGLDQYLDPRYGAGGDEAALTELVLAQEDLWTERLSILEKVASMKEVLDSKPIAECAGSAGELGAVTLKQAELDTLSTEQAERVSALLHTYNCILGSLSSTFEEMDRVITRAEAAPAS